MLTRKELFINDDRRVSYLSAVYSRIYRGKSVLIEGDYGAGKSRFLNLIKPKKRQVIPVESLFNIHETLASILKKLSHDVKPTYRRTPEYLERICNLKNHIIVIDEANDLSPRIWPFLKRIIDAEVPVVLAGLPSVRAFLADEHPDIISRLKVLILYPIIVEDFIHEYKKKIDPEAIEQIYIAVNGDMRKFEEICVDCMDRAKELKYAFVDFNLALEFINDLPIIL